MSLAVFALSASTIKQRPSHPRLQHEAHVPAKLWLAQCRAERRASRFHDGDEGNLESAASIDHGEIEGFYPAHIFSKCLHLRDCCLAQHVSSGTPPLCLLRVHPPYPVPHAPFPIQSDEAPSKIPKNLRASSLKSTTKANLCAPTIALVHIAEHGSLWPLASSLWAQWPMICS